VIYLLVAIVVALLLDHGFGEPRRFHPLVGFGRIAQQVEAALNQGEGRLLRGVIALSIMLLPLLLVAALLQWWLWSLSPWIFAAVAAVLLCIAIARHSLGEHARDILQALQANDLPLAREKLSMIVTRDTSQLDASGISAATVESVLENGSDAVTATLFWFVLAGLPGIVLHRAVNTLDAMWGYRTERFREFGWAAARCDDLLNYLPARLTALSYALVGATSTALRCWFTQARHWESPNAGPVMAAGAGALRLQLGGGAWYHGAWEERPLLGAGDIAQADDIGRALKLLDRALLLWIVVLLVITAWPR
jgi:adenosylcobinamide-phosphate synthase